jgi:hypothetical protein
MHRAMKRVVITISEYYLDRLSIVAEGLQEEGLTITHLYEFGVIIGVAEEEAIPRIRRHKEVAALTEEKQADVPPPDSTIQSREKE